MGKTEKTDGNSCSGQWNMAKKIDKVSSPDPPATLGRANARFPNWGLTVAIVIFWLTPWAWYEC